MDQIRQSILARARIDGYTTWWARRFTGSDMGVIKAQLPAFPQRLLIIV